nr:phosphate acyltransferase [Mycoplasmopsis bovis]
MHTTSKFSAYISSLLKEKCQKQILSVLFIDGDDKRAREAALYFKKNNLARPIMLLENESQVVDDGLENIILSKEEESIKAYADELVKIRNGKEDYETCLKNMHTRPYYGAMMIKLKDVDSAVGGLIYSTADILRALLLNVLVQNQELKLFLSVIVMHKDDEQLIFTDPSTVQKPRCRTISWHCRPMQLVLLIWWIWIV